MTGLVVILGGVVAAVLGVTVLAVPRETSEAFKSTADKSGLPAGLYNPRLVRFTALLFVAAGIVLAVVGWTMASSGR